MDFICRRKRGKKTIVRLTFCPYCISPASPAPLTFDAFIFVTAPKKQYLPSREIKSRSSHH